MRGPTIRDVARRAGVSAATVSRVLNDSPLVLEPTRARVQAAVDELGRLAEPGDRLLVGPSDLRRTWYSDAFIYWLFPELDPATYYIEMDPGLANAEGSRLSSDVESADFVILTGLWDGWMEPNSSMDFGSDAPNQVLRDHFCVVGDYEDGQAVLYRRCR